MFTTLGATFFTTGAKLLPLCAARSIGWSETLTLGGVAESLATTATPSHPATASRPCIRRLRFVQNYILVMPGLSDFAASHSSSTLKTSTLMRMKTFNYRGGDFDE